MCGKTVKSSKGTLTILLAADDPIRSSRSINPSIVSVNSVWRYILWFVPLFHGGVISQVKKGILQPNVMGTM